MMQPGHLIGAPVAVLGGGILVMKLGVQVDVGQLAACAMASVPTAGGWLSPDCDQRWPFKRLGHRYTTHWIGFPIMAICALLIMGMPLPVYGPVLGWLSHIWPYDWLFGKGGRSIPKGIPKGPWSKRIMARSRLPQHRRRWGVGLKVTGGVGDGHSPLEYAFTLALVPTLVWELVVINGMVS